jgi:signal transduction histidine kinase
LGIVSNDELNTRVDVVELHEGERVYIYSDGVTETVSPHGEIFGRERLENVFENNQKPDELFSEIYNSLKIFQAGGEQQDDVALIELQYQQELLESMLNLEDALDSTAILPATGWSLAMELEADIMRHFDPLPLLIKAVTDMQGLRKQRQQLYTIFSELFSNALEHGVLDLSSAMKETSDGFAHYYREREKRLRELKDGKINIEIHHTPKGEGGELVVRFQDSGKGYDFHSDQEALENNLGNCGRGIQLLQSLCDEVIRDGKGNIVEVVYRWH